MNTVTKDSLNIEDIMEAVAKVRSKTQAIRNDTLKIEGKYHTQGQPVGIAGVQGAISYKEATDSLYTALDNLQKARLENNKARQNFQLEAGDTLQDVCNQVNKIFTSDF